MSSRQLHAICLAYCSPVPDTRIGALSQVAGLRFMESGHSGRRSSLFRRSGPGDGSVRQAQVPSSANATGN